MAASTRSLAYDGAFYWSLSLSLWLSIGERCSKTWKSCLTHSLTIAVAQIGNSVKCYTSDSSRPLTSPHKVETSCTALCIALVFFCFWLLISNHFHGFYGGIVRWLHLTTSSKVNIVDTTMELWMINIYSNMFFFTYINPYFPSFFNILLYSYVNLSFIPSLLCWMELHFSYLRTAFSFSV